MGREEKHIIPRDQYRRKRRVFTEDGQEHKRRPETDDTGREFGARGDGSVSYEEARRAQEAERTREFQAAADTDADQQPRGPVAGDNHGSRRSVEDDTPQGESPASTQEQRSQAEPDPDYAPGEQGFKDQSKAAGAVGVTAASQENYSRSTRGAGDRGAGDGIGSTGSTPGAVDRDLNWGPGGPGDNNRNNKNRGGGRGCLTTFLIPLIAGLIGALLALLLFNFFTDDPPATAPDTGESAEGQTEETGGMTGDSREEIEGIKDELQSEEGNEEKEISDTTAAIQKARQSVVSVINMQRIGSFLPGMTEEQVPEAEPEEAGTGSGVIYRLTDDSAYIVTNAHVVDGAQEVQVNLESGDQLDAELIGSDIWTDLAVLRVDRGNIDSAIDFGDSDNLLVGETAIAIGSPLGETFSGSVSQGIISGLDRSVPVDIDGDGNYDWESNVIQTDAAINPGNSGGALVDAAGNLIGVNSMKISMPTVEGIGFAIPSNEVRQVVGQLEENGEVQRPYLGILLQDLYTVPAEVLVNEMNLPDDVDSGVIISHIEDGTPASDAGLQELDVIVSLDGQEVRNMMELRQYLYYEKQQGEDMEIEYYRDGGLQSTTATLE